MYYNLKMWYNTSISSHIPDDIIIITIICVWVWYIDNKYCSARCYMLGVVGVTNQMLIKHWVSLNCHWLMALWLLLLKWHNPSDHSNPHWTPPLTAQCPPYYREAAGGFAGKKSIPSRLLIITTKMKESEK